MSIRGGEKPASIGRGRGDLLDALALLPLLDDYVVVGLERPRVPLGCIERRVGREQLAQTLDRAHVEVLLHLRRGPLLSFPLLRLAAPPVQRLGPLARGLPEQPSTVLRLLRVIVLVVADDDDIRRGRILLHLPGLLIDVDGDEDGVFVDVTRHLRPHLRMHGGPIDLDPGLDLPRLPCVQRGHLMLQSETRHGSLQPVPLGLDGWIL